MKLTCYALHHDVPAIVPAPPDRRWMDEFTGHHAYKCLPLAIANCYGWQILLSERVEVTWTGGPDVSDLVVVTPRAHTATSNFARGVVTFDVPYVFRTEPGYNLMVVGPTNEFKDGATALTAVIESNWLPYTFTMNYQMTRPGYVVWQKDEPFCQVFVVPAKLQETVRPELRNARDHPELQAELEAWTRKREAFRSLQASGDAATIKQAWQRDYFNGLYPDGRVVPDHQKKLRLKPLEDKR